jgi:hypothetical protein
MLSENAIQQQVAVLLHSYCRPDVTWFAVPNGEWRYPKTAARLKASGVRPGAPDLVVVVRGRFHGIEIKRDTGRLSDVQETFGLEIERAGGGYHVCRGLRETIDCLLGLTVFIPGVKFTFSEGCEGGQVMRPAFAAGVRSSAGRAPVKRAEEK